MKNPWLILFLMAVLALPFALSDAQNAEGERKILILTTGGAGAPAAHAASHTDGTDDIQSATAGQKGVATAAQITKLDGIEALATADQSDAEIKTGYENNADTNAFTDAEQTKLTGIETAATANSTDVVLLARANHTGTQLAATISDFDATVSANAAVAANTAKVTNVSTALSTGTVTATSYGITSDGGADDVVIAQAIATTSAGLLSGADKSKLDGIESGATADQTSIVGITGSTAEFNAALTDGSFTTGGGTSTGTNTGDQTITLTGGVTGSGTGSFAATVITNANLTGGVTSVGNSATVITNADLTGHVTSTGNAAVLGSFTVGQLSTALSDATLSGNNTGDQTITLTGDVTGSGTGSFAATVADNSITLAKMAGGTDGNLITYDANGDPAAVATGTAAQVLTSNGAGAAPTMQDVPASALPEGTLVLDHSDSTGSTPDTTSSAAFVDTSLDSSFVPSVAGDYIVEWDISAHHTGSNTSIVLFQVDIDNDGYTVADDKGEDFIDNKNNDNFGIAGGQMILTLLSATTPYRIRHKAEPSSSNSAVKEALVTFTLITPAP